MARAITIDNVHEYLAQHEQKELLRFVAVGSVDDGKSTLIGRLLHDAHGIYEDQLAAVESASKRRGSAGGKLDLSLLTDGLRAEREQGITIDVAYRYFSTDRRKFIIADTPGHVQYTRNMATGASTANVALILIDARHGVLQQSRRHAYIASLLGIPHLAVCVNKMDLVDFDASVFARIKADFEGFAGGLSFEAIHFIPVSAIDGDNVVSRSQRMPWYTGETLLSFLETVPLTAAEVSDQLRFPVQYVLRPDLTYRGFCGQVASGVVRTGDRVTVLPSRRQTSVASIDTYDGAIEEAFPPMSVTLRLTDEIDVSRGDLIVHEGDEPSASQRFEAHVVWMSETPLDKRRAYLLKHATRMVRATVQAVKSRLDLDTLHETPADALALNDIGTLELACNQPIFADPYTRNRHAGAFVLIDVLSNNTVGAGMFLRRLEDAAERQHRRAESLVGAGERRARFGHAPAVIWFDGEPSAAQQTLAYALERALFEDGRLVTVIDVAALVDGSRSPELCADVAAQCVALGAIVILSRGLPRPAEREALRRRFSPPTRITLLGEAEDACVVPLDDAKAAVAAVRGALVAAGIVDAEGDADE